MSNTVKTVLPYVGAAIGAIWGAPQAGFAVGSLVAGAIPGKAQGPRIGDTPVQTTQEGAPRTIVYGTMQVRGNTIAQSRLFLADVEENQGGKGGTDVSNEHCYRTFAIRICEGPIAGILRIWEDDKLVYDVREVSAMLAESAQWVQGINFHLGEETQLPDPFLELYATGIGSTPAYRGSAYAVFVQRDLTTRSGSISQYRFEVATSVTTTPLEKIDNWIPVSGGFSGNSWSQNPLDGPEHVDSTRSLPDCRVAHLVIEVANTIPSANVNTTYSVKWGVGGAKTFSGSIAGNGKVTVQIATLGEDVSINAVISQPSAVVTPLSYSWTINYPKPSEAGSDYLPYYGGFTAPDMILEDDPYFGIMVDTVLDTMFAAEWGPDFSSSVGSPVTLQSIVADIHARCGISSAKYNVSELTDLVTGLALSGDYTGADAINTLRSIYFFDKSAYDKKLHYPKRGAAVVDTITIDDLVEIPDTTTRTQAIELPKKLHLRFQEPDSGYSPAIATQSSSSPDTLTTGETTVEVPVAMSVDKGAQTVDKMYKIMRAELPGETEIVLPDEFLRRVPGNCIGLSLRGRVTRERIEEMDYADGQLKVKLKRDRQSAYTSTLTGIPIPPPTLPPSTIVGDTLLAVMDIPARIDSEDDLNYLVAVTGALPAWYGATVQRSLDSGASYTNIASITASVIGSLLDDVPAASEFFTDTTNTVRVQLFRSNQSLDSLTDAQFLSEQGAFALEKADGSWEVMQCRDWDDEGDGIYAGTVLHRGLLNSGASAHISGAKFVMLDRATHIDAQSSWIGAELTHRAPSYTQPSEAAGNVTTTTFAGRSQTEWPVAYLEAERDGSDNITATWTPRHRFGSDDAPVASINFQGYRVTLDDGVSPVNFDTTSPSFTYDASSMGPSIDVSVSALNRITGAGPAVTESI